MLQEDLTHNNKLKNKQVKEAPKSNKYICMLRKFIWKQEYKNNIKNTKEKQ